MYKDKESTKISKISGEAGILLHIFGKFMILKLKSSHRETWRSNQEWTFQRH
jgi:hypothetical protein